MSGILDQMLHPKQYTPASTEEYVALQIAKRFQDGAAIRRYLHYISQHGVERALQAYASAMVDASPVTAFHSSLSSNKP